MKKLTFLLSFLFSINGFITLTQIFERQILTSTDDAEEKFNGSYVTTTSSDIEMVYDSWNSQGLQKLGFRFDNITIPSNATITNAYIQFTADGASSGSVTMTIKGENIANSTTFSNSANNISNRTLTSSSVIWSSIPSWSDLQATSGQRTPNLSSIVSEIMTSNGWQNGNPITFIFAGTGSETEMRRSFSFEGNASKAAKLVIEYISNSDIDLELLNCNSPMSNMYPNPASSIQVVIANNGNLIATSYTVSYSINNTIIATEPGTQSIASGENLTFTFAQTANLSNFGIYDLDFEVTINNDENSSNNSYSKTVTVVNEFDSLFFNEGSSWKYWDLSSNPGTTWNTVGFNDTAWSIGIGHMGFGNSDEQTILTSGLISYYFRKKVTIEDANQLEDVYLHVVHDEGAIIYINGQEVARSEMMPLGVISHTTAARQTINSSLENRFFTYKINNSYFVTGENTIAISVRNKSTSDSDVSFDCYITSEFEYDQDGPYVYYQGNNIIVEEITPDGLVSNTYTGSNGLQLTCQLPHMNTSFSFTLKPQLTIEPSTYDETPSKFLTISDFDGHIEGFTMLLKGEGIIDNNFNWIYGDGHLIISGDLFDRGFHITECMWLLYKLESEAELAGGKVHLVIGNHEMMNMTDDWRYVELKYFNDAHLMGKRMSELYGSDTELGRWLRTKNIMERVGDYAFIHGGLSPQLANLNLTYDQINDYGRLEMNGTPCPDNACTIVNGNDGVYWYRGMADEELTQVEVDEILDGFGVKRVIFGHTKDNTIRSLYEGRVLAIDMYHINNFNNGFMEALQFELGCFYLFHTDETNQQYTQIGDCDEFNINSNSLLQINEENQIQIYPNPTASMLNITIPIQMIDEYDFTILDLEGKIVKQGKVNNGQALIEIKQLTEGKYVLTFKSSKNVITGHFIIKN
jgi:hypothetical protein